MEQSLCFCVPGAMCLSRGNESMRQQELAVRLRIFLGEDEKYQGRPLYEEIVVQAQQSRLAGATVFRGYMGYGLASGLSANKILRSSQDLPVVVEILDTEGKVNAFMEAKQVLLPMTRLSWRACSVSYS